MGDRCRLCDCDMLHAENPVKYRGIDFCSDECKEDYRRQRKGNMRNKQSRSPSLGIWKRDNNCGLWEENCE